MRNQPQATVESNLRTNEHTVSLKGIRVEIEGIHQVQLHKGSTAVRNIKSRGSDPVEYYAVYLVEGNRLRWQGQTHSLNAALERARRLIEHELNARQPRIRVAPLPRPSFRY